MGSSNCNGTILLYFLRGAGKQGMLSLFEVKGTTPFEKPQFMRSAALETALRVQESRLWFGARYVLQPRRRNFGPLLGVWCRSILAASNGMNRLKGCLKNKERLI